MKISCIIPAYNEEKRIAKVLKVINNHPLINEIIVVNDGSTDNTYKIVKNFDNIKLISYKKNRGKSGALKKGIEYAKYNTLLLLDADLVGLKQKNITDLIEPIVKRKCDVSFSLRTKLWYFYGLDFITGERVIKRDVIPYNKLDKIPGFGIEVLMNRKIIRKKLRVGLLNGIMLLVHFQLPKIDFKRNKKINWYVKTNV
jgi:glycosyltransferase involved in cell wall biosynthesis